MSLPAPAQHPVRGIALVVGATLCFALLDTTSQYVGPLVPALMAVWMRWLAQTVTTTLLLWPQQGRQLLRMRSPGLHLLRGLFLLASSTASFFSLIHIPVGEFTALMMVIPLLVTALAAPMLGERTGRLTWLLLAGGLLGAMIILRPKGSGLGLALMLPLLVVVFNAATQLLTSHMVKTENPGAIHFYTGIVGLAASTLLLPWIWEPLGSWTLWSLAALIGFFSSLGHYLLIRSYHHAPVSRLMPYMYAQIAFATVAGAWVFGHVPDRWTWLGIGLIVLCGFVGVRSRLR